MNECATSGFLLVKTGVVDCTHSCCLVVVAAFRTGDASKSGSGVDVWRMGISPCDNYLLSSKCALLG